MRWLFSLVAVLVSVGCDDSTGPVEPGPPTIPSTILIEGPSVLSLEEQGVFAAEVRDQTGAIQPFAVTWSVSDTALATIDASGTLTTTDAGPGSLYVIGMSGPAKDSVPLQVVAHP